MTGEEQNKKLDELEATIKDLKVENRDLYRQLAERKTNQWWVEIRKPHTQCPYFEAEDDSCYILSTSNDELIACEKAPCPIKMPESA